MVAISIACACRYVVFTSTILGNETYAMCWVLNYEKLTTDLPPLLQELWYNTQGPVINISRLSAACFAPNFYWIFGYTKSGPAVCNNLSKPANSSPTEVDLNRKVISCKLIYVEINNNEQQFSYTAGIICICLSRWIRVLL